MPSSAITLLFEFDWANNGTWTDEAAYVLAIKGHCGLRAGDPIQNGVAHPGHFALHLRNETQRFSPDYASGALYGNLLPRRPFRIRVTDGVTTWNVFRGYVQKIVPDSGSYGPREVAIEVTDLLGILAVQKISMDLQRSKRADELIAGVLNIAFNAPAASGTVTFNTNVANNDTVTIAGQVYTFKTTLGAGTYQVLIGGTAAASAANLRAAINSEGINGTTYTRGTNRLAGVLATLSGSVLTLTATWPGAAGNALTLAKSSSHLTLSGATLTGGADRPVGLTSLQTGSEAFDVAADLWQGESTSALDALREIVTSEHGFLFVQRDGTLTFYNRKQVFTALTSSLTLNLDPFRVYSNLSVDRVSNQIKVTIHPRNYVCAISVLASVPTDLRLPPADAVTGPSVHNITLKFRDSAGQPCGGTDLQLPLVVGTDLMCGTYPGGWTDRNNSLVMGPTIVKGSEVTIPFYNSEVARTWYLHGLQVRGRTVTTYDPAVFTKDDATSQSTYLQRVLAIDLALSSDDAFCDALAAYLLDRYKNPFTNIERIGVDNDSVFGSANIFALNLFDVVTLTDAQEGFAGIKVFLIA